MTTIIVYRLASGETAEVAADDGTSLMRAAVANGIPGILGECGGSASCATCHVYVEEGGEAFPPPGEAERDMLEFAASPVDAGSRLGCQCVVRSGVARVVVRVPERQV